MADGNSRKEQLLAAARERLSTEQQAREAGRSSPDDSGPEIRYRGKVVRQSGASTPGSPTRKQPGGGKDDVRASLQKIKDLYHDGLISREEAEQKRKDVLDRL